MLFATIPLMEENPEAGFSFFAAQMIMSLAMGLSFVIGLPMALLGGIGLTRVAAYDRLSAAFELSEVWALARRGHGRFFLSFVMLFGLYFLGLLIAQVAVYTIILCVLYPVLLGLLMFYLFVVGGALFGAAYHDTQSAPAPNPISAAHVPLAR
jgi:hypothetical protein